jgi:hypothetical protein
MTATTRTVETLLQILADEDGVGVASKVEAAELLVGYECPHHAIEVAQKFLNEVFENKDWPIDLRLSALRIARKFEAPRASAGVVKLSDNADYIAERRSRAINAAGVCGGYAGTPNCHPPQK